MSKQTATDWLEMEFIKLEQTIGVNHKMYELIEQAKEMEKEQIIDSRLSAPLINSPFENNYREEAEQYYKQTFKNK